MAIIKTIDALDAWKQAQPETATRVLVPTMGALHAGHISLIERAKQLDNASIIASIFVNPTQFSANEDLDSYPRTLDLDLAKLQASGVDAVFLPDVAAVYPDGPEAQLRAGSAAKRWEGEHRPDMFDGVVSVVARLFQLVEPGVALFGEKDFQQLAVIQQMVAAEGLAVEVVGSPTIREVDGLAMSSRNAYLSAEERAMAPKLYEALVQCKHGFIDAQQAKQHVLGAGFHKVDYLALVDASTLEPLDAPKPGARILVAAWLGKARLIDNVGI